MNIALNVSHYLQVSNENNLIINKLSKQEPKLPKYFFVIKNKPKKIAIKQKEDVAMPF